MSDDDLRREFEGYADYKTVSNRVGVTIDNAVDACATLSALHTEGARVRPRLAAELRRDIVSAALMLVPDLEGSQDGEENVYADILERWGVDEEGEFTDDGFLGRLRETNLQQECPEWIHQLAIDIRRAGWEIGYLRAGRINTELDVDEDEREARSMFE